MDSYLIFRGWIWTLMALFIHKGDTGGWSNSYQVTRNHNQTGSAWYVAARPTGDFTKHQRIPAKSNTAYSTAHQAACSQPTLISPLFRLPNFFMSTLHKPSQRNSRKPETKQQQPTSHLLYSFPETITMIDMCLYCRVYLYMSVYVWLQPEINSLFYGPRARCV